MDEHATLLTTINAPYKSYVDAPTLAGYLKDGEITVGQVNSFLTEVPVEKQLSFAKQFAIPKKTLMATAQAFHDWSGQVVALVA